MLRRPDYGPVAVSLIVALVGLSVLIGWKTENYALVQLHPSWVPMQFNTALCFLLSGVALLGFTLQRSWCRAIAWSILVVAGLTGLQFVLRVDLGLDQLFHDHSVTTKTSSPGRMAPNTALCFVLLSLCLLLRRSRAQWLAIAMLGLGSIAIVGYVTEVSSAYSWGRLTSMALHTALCHTALGVVLAVRCRRAASERRLFWGLDLRDALFFVLILMSAGYLASRQLLYTFTSREHG